MPNYQWNFRANTPGGSQAVSTITSLTQASQGASGMQHTLAKAFGIATSKLNLYAAAIDIGVQAFAKLAEVSKQVYHEILRIYVPLQQVINEIEILGRTSGEQPLKELLRTIDDLAASTPRTATQVAETARAILRSGQSAGAAKEILDDVIRASIGLGADTEKTFNVASTALAKFSGRLGFIPKAGDEVFETLKYVNAAANSAKTNFTELASALEKGRSGGLQSFNSTLKETLIAIALLANEGKVGSRAMTNLASNLTQVIRYKDQLADWGIKIADINGNYITLTELVKEFQRVFADKTMEERGAMMVKVFGTQGDTLEALIRAGVEGFAKMDEQIQKNLDTLDQLYAAQRKAIGGQQKAVESAKEAVTKHLGVLFGPLIEEWLQMQASAIKSFADTLGTFVEKVMARFRILREQGKHVVDAWVEAMSGQDLGQLVEGMAERLAPLRELLTKIIGGALALAFQAFMDGIPVALKEAGKGIRGALWGAIKEIPVLFARLMMTELRNMLRLIPGMSKLLEGTSAEPQAIAETAATPVEFPLLPEVLEPEEQAGPTLAEQAAQLYQQQQDNIKTNTQQAVLAQAGKIMAEQNLPFEMAALMAQQQEFAQQQHAAAAAILEAKKQVLSTEQEITKNQREQVTLGDTLVQQPGKLQLALNAVGAAFQTYLIDPVSKFAQDMFAIRDRFGGIEGILEKLHLKRAGITGDTDATTILSGALRQSQQLLQELGPQAGVGARAGLLEKMAERAFGLGQGNTATTYIDQAIALREQQAQNELEAVKIQQTLAQQNVMELGAMLEKTQGASSRAEILRQMIESFQALGDVRSATALQADLQEAMRDASGEQTGILTQQLDYLRIIAEGLLGQKDIAEQQLQEQKKMSENVTPFVLDPSLQMA